ncbi:hypothetical protein [Terriglobus aquaticus]|uniref:Sel1 repeat family protein n=1 Tax=Terriglobus aquaticus TaxID=940139 RepID=A0ABW9KN08_9BACT|nr:hypothetical protein [Terriglobus aquaticus]
MIHQLLNADPDTLPPVLRALQLAARGDWHGAHELAQAGNDRNSAWVHAYLHRQEGDQFNAEYWYRRAGRPVFQGSLDAEWNHIADALYTNS